MRAFLVVLFPFLLISCKLKFVRNSYYHDRYKLVSYGSILDQRDGKSYKTIIIGKQLWMAENLAYKPENGKYMSYKNSKKNIRKYGYLYDFETAKEVCLVGWHLPTIDEWQILNDEKMLKMHNFNKLLLKCGGYQLFDEFRAIDSYGFYWSSSLDSNYDVWIQRVTKGGGSDLYGIEKRGNYSVRCIKD